MGKSIKAVPEVSDEVIVGFINEDSRVLIEFFGGGVELLFASRQLPFSH